MQNVKKRGVVFPMFLSSYLIYKIVTRETIRNKWITFALSLLALFLISFFSIPLNFFGYVPLSLSFPFFLMPRVGEVGIPEILAFYFTAFPVTPIGFYFLSPVAVQRFIALTFIMFFTFNLVGALLGYQYSFYKQKSREQIIKIWL